MQRIMMIAPPVVNCTSGAVSGEVAVAPVASIAVEAARLEAEAPGAAAFEAATAKPTTVSTINGIRFRNIMTPPS
jgi:hypothetical protein